MESIQLSFKTLPGVSTNYTLVIGSNENPKKECKIISTEEYVRFRKLEKKNKRENRKRRKKGKKEKPEKKTVERIELSGSLLDGISPTVIRKHREYNKDNIINDPDDFANCVDEGISKYGERMCGRYPEMKEIALLYGKEKYEALQEGRPFDPEEFDRRINEEDKKAAEEYKKKIISTYH